jgi:hypothetical protein
MTAPKKVVWEVGINPVVQIIHLGGYSQFSVPKPPLLLAAALYSTIKP